MIFNPGLECMDSHALKKLQLASLKNLVETLYGRVPFYRDSMDKMGIKPSDIHSLTDIEKLHVYTGNIPLQNNRSHIKGGAPFIHAKVGKVCPYRKTHGVKSPIRTE